MKNEFEVGEVFQVGLIKMKCVEQKRESGKHMCKGCILVHRECEDELYEMIFGTCIDSERSDGKDVIFVEVKEDED